MEHIPSLKSIFLVESLARPIKAKDFTLNDREETLNLQNLFDGIPNDKFPLRIEYHYGSAEFPSHEGDVILLKDREGNVLEQVDSKNGRFRVMQRQVFKFSIMMMDKAHRGP